jgi:hypothetical protein
LRYLEIEKTTENCDESLVRKVFGERKIIKNSLIKISTEGEEKTFDSKGSSMENEVTFLPNGRSTGCFYDFLMRIK